MSANIHAIIFDMDGLMVDTEPLSRRSWEMVLESFGHKLDDSTYNRMIGLRIDKSSAIIQQAFPMPLTTTELITQKVAYMEEICAEGIPTMPGLMELQAEIAQRQIPWAVATSSHRQHAINTLQQLGLRQSCHAVVAGDEAPQGKPAPDIYLMAAERLGIAPQNCIALEDSAPGCQAAAMAGMVTIAIPNGATHTASFDCAHHIFNSLHDVVEQLDELLSSN